MRIRASLNFSLYISLRDSRKCNFRLCGSAQSLCVQFRVELLKMTDQDLRKESVQSRIHEAIQFR